MDIRKLIPLPSRRSIKSILSQEKDVNIIFKKPHLLLKNNSNRNLFFNHIFKIYNENNVNKNILIALQKLYYCVYYNEDCEDPITFESIYNYKDNIVILDCKHLFHESNIDKLDKHECPLCRQSYDPSDIFIIYLDIFFTRYTTKITIYRRYTK